MVTADFNHVNKAHIRLYRLFCYTLLNDSTCTAINAVKLPQVANFTSNVIILEPKYNEMSLT